MNATKIPISKQTMFVTQKVQKNKSNVIMSANNKNSSHQRKVPANLKSDFSVYFKTKNKLSQNRREKMYLYLQTANGKIFSFCFEYFEFRT